MAHKSKLRGGTVTPSVALPERIGRARKEGRFQQALELSRQFHKKESSADSLALLRQVTVERADQLQSQGHLKEAAQTLCNVLDMGGPPDFQRSVIEKLAGCGCIAQALQLTERLGDPSLRADVLDLAADHALRQGNASLLPAELHSQFDAVVQAFAHAQAGKDDETKAALQTIGLTSPFLEWRILLRGLLAYYANDDARALENWQRLNPRRLPARLAAPLRHGIDADYLAAQPPETQNVLRRQLDSLQGAGSLPALRTIQALLVHRDKMAQAFRAVEGVLPTLRQQVPHLVPRLAACFRWAVIDHGQPEDLDRYLRVFGPLPDDRQLQRMRALALEKNGMLPEAHECWQLFEKEVAAAGTIWPGEQARHVRALIWSHIGAMAAEGEDDEAAGEFLPFARPPRNRDSEFRPSAEECLRKSLELAPESLETHESLFRFLLEKPKKAPLFAAGKKLLERFPNHVETLRTLGSICMEEMRLDEAQDYLQRALAASPLEAGLRAQLIKVHEMCARQYAVGKRYDDARESCRSAMALYDLPGKYALNCLQAAIELKAKNSAGYEEFMATAERDAGHRLPVAYCLMCESIRLKLPPAQKKPLAEEVQKGFAAEVDPSIIPMLLGVLILQRVAGPAYMGQKAHEKKVLGIVEKAPLKLYPEDAVEGVCETLMSIDAAKCQKRWVLQARKLFSANPAFMLMEAALLQPTNGYRCRQLLNQARSRIEALPRGDRQQQLFERLADIEEQLRASDGLHNLMNRMMGMFDEDDDDSF